MLSRSVSVFALFLLGTATLAVAEPLPAFGPKTFEITENETETFEDAFGSPEAGEFVLFLRNGDDESTRVDDAVVTINAQIVVGPGELEDSPDGLRRPVLLEQGDNSIAIELSGVPGSFVTLAIGRRDGSPVFVYGRLVLPWGRDDESRVLSLQLKNGSLRLPRAFRVLFFAPNGDLVGSSEKHTIPARGSLSLPVEALITRGEFEVGSVEVIFTGPGTARLFGTGRQVALPPASQSELQPLTPASVRIFRERPGRPGMPRRPGPGSP